MYQMYVYYFVLFNDVNVNVHSGLFQLKINPEIMNVLAMW
jgi:hypothetical protein